MKYARFSCFSLLFVALAATLLVAEKPACATGAGILPAIIPPVSTPTATTIDCSPNPSTYGATVTIDATVTQSQGSIPDGDTVRFYSGTTIIGTATTTAGVASINISTLSAGSQDLSATYAGNSKVRPNLRSSSSSHLTLPISQITTTTSLTSSATSSDYGDLVTFTATVSPSVADGDTVTFYDSGTSIGAGTTSGGVATLVTSTLLGGSHSITATYAGDTNYATSASNALSQTVYQGAALSSSLNPSTAGDSVTFSATISPSVPDGGTVTFYDSGTSIGAGATTGSVATLAISTLSLGSHSITAVYGGDTGFAASTSGALTQVVKQATTTSLSSSPNPSSFGDSVTFSATISPSVPDGETVTFYNSGTSMGTGTTTGSVATLAISTLAPGNYNLTATYAGDTNYSTSTSSALGQTVNQATTTTTVTSSDNPSTIGDFVTFTATISPSVPNGEYVTFYDGGTSIGVRTTYDGVAALGVRTLSLGSHSITASYPGDTNFTASTSDPLSDTVNLASTPSTTTVTSSANPSAFGDSVTFSATISPSVPDGETVTFYDSDAPVGACITSGGVATLAISTLSLGSHSITASYPGDSTYQASTSSALTQTVASSHTATTLTSSLNPSTFGDSVTFTATVSPSVPDGDTVTFYDSGTSIGSGTTMGSVATLAISTLTAGSHSITATYAGDTNYATSTSDPLSDTVNLASTTSTTTLTSSANPSNYGDSVTFTATVSPSVPDGETVTFLDGSTSIGTGTTTGGVASLQTPELTLGSHSITASYGGDTNYATSTSGALTQTVNIAPTTTGVKSSTNPSNFGQSITLTAWVRPVPPDGETVTFYDGGNSIGTGATAGGLATYSISTLAAGSHSITASYPGDANFVASTSSALVQSVAICHPTTALVSSLNPSIFGGAVTFTSTVSPAVPDGETINFYDGAASKALIGSGTMTGGVASLTTSALRGGSHTIWAYYAGDANHAYSWSSGLAQTVNPAGLTVTVSSLVNPSTYGARVTFTAALSASVPNGEIVTFLDGGNSIGTGKTSGGKATLSTSTLAQGSHSITASYPGDSNYAAAASSAVTQAVNQGVTTTKLTSSPSTSVYGSLVTFTAAVSPSVPDGEIVTFLDGGNSIGTGTTAGGKATLATASLAVGSHSITASYPGDASYAGSTSGALTQTVVVCHPSTTLISSLNPSTYGQPVIFTATVGPAVPDGETVTFYQGASSKSPIGTGTTAGGVATLTTSSLAGGNDTIWAYYPGDANHAYSWSTGLAQTVNPAGLTVTVSSSVNPSTCGAGVTITAALNASVPNGETVMFFDGGSAIGTGKTSGGVATFATAALAQGSHSITARYPGDSNYAAAASSTLTQTVNQGVTMTKLTSSPNASVYGSAVTFTATVSPSVPNGETVTFLDGGNPIGTGTTRGGKATFAAVSLAVGSHSITASYPGDVSYAGSTSSGLTQIVVICHPTTALASSASPSKTGSPVMFTATVGPNVPDGEPVTFYDGATTKKPIGTGTTLGGVAKLTTSTLAAGGHTIWAEYMGDANNAYAWSSGLAQTEN